MAEKQRVEIEILGQKYPIRSEAGPDYVRQLASFVDRRAREIRGDSAGQDAVRVLALTGSARCGNSSTPSCQRRRNDSLDRPTGPGVHRRGPALFVMPGGSFNLV
jgi:Cell division protein ZapA